jgi:hypothetical protein
VRRRGDAGACRIAYDRDGCTALDREHWEDYIDWFIETGVRLRQALDPMFPL